MLEDGNVISKKMKGLQLAQNAKQAKDIAKGKWRIQKKEKVIYKNMDVGYIRMKIQKTLLALSLRQGVMQKKTVAKVKKIYIKARLRGKSNFNCR